MTKNVSVTAFVFVLLALGAPPAAAQGVAPADPNDALFEQGRALRAQHRDADALDTFRRMFAASHQPRAQAQVGLAEGALGQWVAAETDLAGALATSSDPWIRTNRAMLDAAVGTIRTHLGDLELQCNAPRCEVWIGNQPVGTLPSSRPLRVSAGTVHFEVRAAGYLTETRVATVPPGGLARESVQLTVETANHAVAGAAATPTPAASAPLAPVTVASGPSTLGIVGAVAGVAFLGAGVGLYLAGLGAANSYNTDASCPGTDAAVQGATCGGYLSSASLDGTLAIAGFAVGGVLLVAGVALLVRGTNAPAERRTASAFRCGAGPGTVGVSCMLQF